MKSVAIYFFLVLFALCFSTEGYAQQNQPVRVSVSTRKTVIDGVTYFLHRVLPGETLYSIAEAYKVMQKDIVAANPSALTVVRVGEELRIPAQSTDRKAGDILEAGNFVFHIAKRGQTKEDLASQYGVSLERLYQFNPELQYSSIERGQVVKIPRPGADKQSLEQLAGIPVSLKSADTIVVQHEWSGLGGNAVQAAKGKGFRVAMLLPLSLAENRPASVLATDTTLRQDPFTGGLKTTQGNYWVFPQSVNFLNFYEGALLALDSLRSQGVVINLHIYDTGRNPALLQQILSRPEMKQMDLLIGPFYTKLIEQTMAFAQEQGIYCVSPLTNNLNLLQGRPYLLQVTPDAMVVNDSLVAHVVRQQDAFITLATNSRESSVRYARWRTQLKSKIPASRFREVATSADGFPDALLMDGVRNVVVSFSEDEVFVGRMMANINREVQRNNQQVELCGMYSWTRFSNVDQAYLHNVNFVCVAPFFVDYNRSDVLSFLKKHRSYFGMEPVDFFPSGYNYTFLGYDIMWYFGTVLQSCGKEFGPCVSGVPRSSLLTGFRFTRPSAQQGFSNSGVRTIQYTNDFFLRQIR